MSAPRRLAAAGFQLMPAGAQDGVRDALAPREVRRTLDDHRPFLARVDAAIGGFGDGIGLRQHERAGSTGSPPQP